MTEIAAIIHALLVEHGRLTVKQIVTYSGYCRNAVRRHLRTLPVRICDWERYVGKGGRVTAIYELGTRKDKARPVFDRAEYDDRYYQKNVKLIKHKRAGIPAGPFDALMPRRKRLNDEGKS